MENLKIRRAKSEEAKVVRDLNRDLFTSDKDRDPYLNHTIGLKKKVKHTF